MQEAVSGSVPGEWPVRAGAPVTARPSARHGATGAKAGGTTTTVTAVESITPLAIDLAKGHQKLPANSGLIRSGIPITSGQPFRFDPVTDSGLPGHRGSG